MLYLSTLLTNIIKSASRFLGEPFVLLSSILYGFSKKSKESHSLKNLFCREPIPPNFNLNALQFENPSILKKSNVGFLSFQSMIPQPTDVKQSSSSPSKKNNQISENDQTRLSLLNTTVLTLRTYLQIFSVNDELYYGVSSFFKTAKNLLDNIETKPLPPPLVGQIEDVRRFVVNEMKKREGKLSPLQIQKEKLVVPKLLEPDFELDYTGKKKNSELAPEQREQKRLKYLLKQEKKG